MGRREVIAIFTAEVVCAIVFVAFRSSAGACIATVEVVTAIEVPVGMLAYLGSAHA